jgi:tetratricopeptide (TPR) repeat protein
MINEEDDFFENDDFLEILREYEAMIKSGQPVYMDADDLAEIADYYNASGDFDKCHGALDRALEIHPGSTAPLVFKAREAMNDGDYAKAEKYISKIIDTSDFDYYYVKGELLIRNNKSAEADKYLEGCVDNSNEEYQDYILDVAGLFSDYMLFDIAYKWICKANQEESRDFKELIANILFHLGKFDDCDRIYNELLDNDPFSSSYWNCLSSAQFMKDDYKNALTSSEYAIAIDPKDKEATLNKANSLFHLEDIEEALKYYRRYSSLAPNDEIGYFFQGVALNNLFRYQEAVKCLKRADELSEGVSINQLQIYQELAFSYSSLGKLKLALNYINKTDNLECDHIEMKILRGHIYLENNNLEKALELFSEALNQSDNATITMMRIAISFYDNKMYKESYDLFKKVFRKGGKGWAEGYSYMALCCRHLNKIEDFMKYLKKASKINPEEAKKILGDFFPEEMEPREYYNYMYNKIKDYLK